MGVSASNERECEVLCRGIFLSLFGVYISSFFVMRACTPCRAVLLKF